MRAKGSSPCLPRPLAKLLWDNPASAPRSNAGQFLRTNRRANDRNRRGAAEGALRHTQACKNPCSRNCARGASRSACVGRLSYALNRSPPRSAIPTRSSIRSSRRSTSFSMPWNNCLMRIAQGNVDTRPTRRRAGVAEIHFSRSSPPRDRPHSKDSSWLKQPPEASILTNAIRRSPISTKPCNKFHVGRSKPSVASASSATLHYRPRWSCSR